MLVRIFAPVATLLCLDALFIEPVLAGQVSDRATAEPSGRTTYAPPRTTWGEADLQGTWTTSDVMNVPLQRPAQFGDRLYLTDEEFAARIKADEQNRRDNPTIELGRRSFRQTSLIADPPDGRLPAFTSEAEQRRTSGDLGTSGAGPFNRVEDFTLVDRCITRGIVGSMLPATNANGLRIIQAPGLVAISHEVVHDTRVIYTDGRPHLGPGIRQYMGDSRGRWEGNTLVVETTNLTDRTSIGVNGIGVHHSAEIRLTERLTRTAVDVITYEIRVEDPRTYTRPFTITLPLTAPAGFRVFPYECHEGNYALANMLSGARAQDKALDDDRRRGIVREGSQVQGFPLTIAISAASNEQDRFVGTWHADIPAAITIALDIAGTAVNGTVRLVTAATAAVIDIFDGRIAANVIAFKVTSPDGGRTITFTGTVAGDEMAFTREVEVRPGGAPGGQGIFGASGPRTFIAKRAR